MESLVWLDLMLLHCLIDQITEKDRPMVRDFFALDSKLLGMCSLLPTYQTHLILVIFRADLVLLLGIKLYFVRVYIVSLLGTKLLRFEEG